MERSMIRNKLLKINGFSASARVPNLLLGAQRLAKIKGRPESRQRLANDLASLVSDRFSLSVAPSHFKMTSGGPLCSRRVAPRRSGNCDIFRRVVEPGQEPTDLPTHALVVRKSQALQRSSRVVQPPLVRRPPVAFVPESVR